MFNEFRFSHTVCYFAFGGFYHITPTVFIPMLEEHLCVTSSILYFFLCVLCVFSAFSVVKFPFEFSMVRVSIKSLPKSAFCHLFCKGKAKKSPKRLRVITHNLGLKPEAINIYLLWRYFYRCCIHSFYYNKPSLSIPMLEEHLCVLFPHSFSILSVFSAFSRMTREWLISPLSVPE